MSGTQRIEIVHGDLTTMEVDAIVNAANRALAGGGGVDGAIHRAAGPDLKAACMKLGGCATGDAKMTDGFALPARYVIHAVGPVWYGGDHGEADLLASCYRRALELADEAGLATIAFPSISTGAYRFPLDQAARIAIGTVHETLPQHPGIEVVYHVCFDAKTLRAYERAYQDLVA